MFSLFIVYDTQLIIGGKHHSHQFSIDEYVFAALSLYIVRAQVFFAPLLFFATCMPHPKNHTPSPPPGHYPTLPIHTSTVWDPGVMAPQFTFLNIKKY